MTISTLNIDQEILLKWDHWHIEPSSICAIKCPRCPRAEVPDSLLNRQLDLNFFKNQIGVDVVQQIKKITFCGNDGDPIYCREFLEIVKWIKDVHPSIQLTIITNGSYKDAAWWNKLALVLDSNDHMHWSIDGWDQLSNQQYRINSDWNSIITGIRSFSSANADTYKTWAAIGFKFNEHNIEEMKSLAKLLKFDQFQLTKSTKFGSKYPTAYGKNDYLEPSDKNLISTDFRFERQVESLSNKTHPDTKIKEIFLRRANDLKNTDHSAICFIGSKGVFLNSRGEFYPCCWTANRYEHNQAWQGKFNLNQKSFKEILNDSFWITEFLKFDNLECKTKCTKQKLNDLNHTLEW